jgi:hypothetical protein
MPEMLRTTAGPPGGQNCIVTWSDARSGAGVDIYGQNASILVIPQPGVLGTFWPAGQGVQVTSGILSATNRALALNTSGDALLLWADRRNYNGADPGIDLFATRLDAWTGAQVAGWTANGNVVSDRYGSGKATSVGRSVIADDNDGLFVAFADNRVTPSGISSSSSVFIQRVLGTGVLGKRPAPEPSAPSSPPRTLELVDLYPNPASGDPTLIVRTGQSGPLDIEVYSTLGSRTAAWHISTPASGEYRVPLAGLSELPRGSYFCRVTTVRQVLTSPLVLIR